MYQIIYFSEAVHQMSTGELSLLLVESKAWNAAHDLTGLLVYIEGLHNGKTQGRFMQVLEGSSAEVILIFNKIRTDDRHHKVVLVKHEPLAMRNFGDWDMKLEQIDLSEHPELTGFFDLNKSTLDILALKNTDIALQFLMNFKNEG